MNRIDGLTACVNYSDLLALSIERWATSLASLTVVTTTSDFATAELVERHGGRVFKTDVFTANGATFNKGAAMEAARQEMPWKDWILFFDSDIVPQADWRKVAEPHLQPGNLYSARRYDAPTPEDIDSDRLKIITTDGIGVGYFQLFHSSDAKVQETPLLETCWKHAGVYDCNFMHRWTAKERHLLPIRLVHVGPRDNWFGRGNKADFEAMQAERKRLGGWEHERIDAEVTA